MSEIIAYKLISGNSSVQAIAALPDIQHQLFPVVQGKNSVFPYQIHSINVLNFMGYWNCDKHKNLGQEKHQRNAGAHNKFEMQKFTHQFQSIAKG